MAVSERESGWAVTLIESAERKCIRVNIVITRETENREGGEISFINDLK
jgi:hypothetical protein